MVVSVVLPIAIGRIEYPDSILNYRAFLRLIMGSFLDLAPGSERINYFSISGYKPTPGMYSLP